MVFQPKFLGPQELYERCCPSVRGQFSDHKNNDVVRRCLILDEVARLLPMVPIESWRNSTFCITKIEDFRASLMLTSWSTLSTYLSKRRSE